MVLDEAIAPEVRATLADELTDVAETLRRSTVHVRGSRLGAGSGVIWQPDGLIITNAHVARGDRAAVELWDGREFEAEVTARDESRDLAALRVNGTSLPAAPIGDSDRLRVGELVLAVGNPLGLSGAVTTGIVHAIAPAPQPGHGTWVQADIHLAPGNSGGPLANAAGEVIGVNSMVAGGLGLAVPSNTVQRFLRDRGQRPRLGLTMQPVLVPLAGGRAPGLLVLEVAARSPAEEAGLAVGDVVIGVAGRLFQGPRDFALALEASDETLLLDVLRGGRRVTRVVKPELVSVREQVKDRAGEAA